MSYEYLKYYTVFFEENLQKYGVVRTDAAMYDERIDAERRADFMNQQANAASKLGSARSERKAKSSKENGKKGGRPKKTPTKEELLELDKTNGL